MTDMTDMYTVVSLSQMTLIYSFYLILEYLWLILTKINVIIHDTALNRES